MTQSKPLPDIDLLNKLFYYNGRDLIRLVSRSNAVRVGDIAGSVDKHGYKVVKIGNGAYKVHRIIYKMIWGEEPDHIDHINGEVSDNSASNLRSVSSSGNSKNRAVQKRNKTGVTGVRWSVPHNKWRAIIKVEGKIVHLGMFGCILEAVLVRKEAEKQYGFHENHGRAA